MKNTERMARLIQWMMLANWNALLTKGNKKREEKTDQEIAVVKD